jgi:hypothetical protein
MLPKKGSLVSISTSCSVAVSVSVNRISVSNVFAAGVFCMLRNWRHSLASLIAIALGLVSVSLFHGYLADVKEQFAEFFVKRSRFGDVIIEKGGVGKSETDPWKAALDNEDLRLLDEITAKGEFGISKRVPTSAESAGTGTLRLESLFGRQTRRRFW